MIGGGGRQNSSDYNFDFVLSKSKIIDSPPSQLLKSHRVNYLFSTDGYFMMFPAVYIRCYWLFFRGFLSTFKIFLQKGLKVQILCNNPT